MPSKESGHMAKELKVLIKGDPRNPSVPCISHACTNRWSFFNDTLTFYGEDDSGTPIALTGNVNGWSWVERDGSWVEIKGRTEDQEWDYKAVFETRTKTGEIRCKAAPKSSYKGELAVA
ncbi:MAG: hypothetical protein KBD29_04540 [Candidatus Magasanikbacteria bacterium]|nr:hypothetical protein [Candidatus Magasanikbacteria bacterium]